MNTFLFRSIIFKIYPDKRKSQLFFFFFRYIVLMCAQHGLVDVRKKKKKVFQKVFANTKYC